MSQKELKLRTVGPSYAIYWEGGGEVPRSLKGLFTSQKEAHKAIDTWRAAKPAKPRQSRKAADGEKQN